MERCEESSRLQEEVEWEGENVVATHLRKQKIIFICRIEKIKEKAGQTNK